LWLDLRSSQVVGSADFWNPTATLREMDARDAADAQRAADQQAARRRSIQDQLTELQRQIDATPATP
jgi:hypothetical protein